MVTQHQQTAATHVVCNECGARWAVSYEPGHTSPVQPRECRNPGCDATWLELPMFWEMADADRAAAAAGQEG